MRAARSVRHILNLPGPSYSTASKDFGRSFTVYVHWKCALEEEVGWCLWNPISNATVESIHKPDKDGENARYMSIGRLLKSYREKG